VGWVASSEVVHGEDVASADAAASVSVRLGLTALVVAVLATATLVGAADGARKGWSSYPAPADACPGSTDPAAALAVQRRAVTCLLNWARVQHGQRKLALSSSLQRAAALKGQGVASCGQFSHTPCASDLTDPVRRAGYEYSSFAENLFAGTSGVHSARDVVNAWLQSEGHRKNMLHPGFRHMGAARVAAGGLLGYGSTVVWVAQFASPR
jgi:uncharacterized protein YkwD